MKFYCTFFEGHVYEYSSMNAKSTVETLHALVRQVFRTFYPENFIVVNELLRQSEYVYAAQLAGNLNLAEPTVAKALNDLRQKRFVAYVKYKELALFWAFDYHAFVNIVRYKVHMLKQAEANKSVSIGAGRGGKAGGGGGGYVCLRCERTLTWEAFVKLAANKSASTEPVCPQRGCGGPLMRESKRAAEGLRPLEQLGRALQRLDGAEIPVVGRREMERLINEEAQREDDERPDGGPQYDMPVTAMGGGTRLVVQLGDAPMGMGPNVQPNAVRLSAPPPELAALAPGQGPRRGKELPPWLNSQEWAEEQQQQRIVNEEQQEVKMAMEETNSTVVDLRKVDFKTTLGLEEAVREYAARLPHQLSLAATGPSEAVSAQNAAWFDSPIVSAGGQPVHMSMVGHEHVARMDDIEYRCYYDLYEAECRLRIQQLLQPREGK